MNSPSPTHQNLTAPGGLSVGYNKFTGGDVEQALQSGVPFEQAVEARISGSKHGFLHRVLDQAYYKLRGFEIPLQYGDSIPIGEWVFSNRLMLGIRHVMANLLGPFVPDDVRESLFGGLGHIEQSYFKELGGTLEQFHSANGGIEPMFHGQAFSTFLQEEHLGSPLSIVTFGIFGRPQYAEGELYSGAFYQDRQAHTKFATATQQVGQQFAVDMKSGYDDWAIGRFEGRAAQRLGTLLSGSPLKLTQAGGLTVPQVGPGKVHKQRAIGWKIHSGDDLIMTGAEYINMLLMADEVVYRFAMQERRKPLKQDAKAEMAALANAFEAVEKHDVQTIDEYFSDTAILERVEKGFRDRIGKTGGEALDQEEQAALEEIQTMQLGAVHLVKGSLREELGGDEATLFQRSIEHMAGNDASPPHFGMNHLRLTKAYAALALPKVQQMEAEALRTEEQLHQQTTLAQLAKRVAALEGGGPDTPPQTPPQDDGPPGGPQGPHNGGGPPTASSGPPGHDADSSPAPDAREGGQGTDDPPAPTAPRTPQDDTQPLAQMRHDDAAAWRQRVDARGGHHRPGTAWQDMPELELSDTSHRSRVRSERDARRTPVPTIAP